MSLTLKISAHIHLGLSCASQLHGFWFVFDFGQMLPIWEGPSFAPVLVVIAGISSVTPFIPANLLLGGLLPDIWNVSVWETCKVFHKKSKIIFAWKTGGLARFSIA
jgi:hypothetical protein